MRFWSGGLGLGTIGYRFRSICWWHMGSIGFRFWIEFLGRMVRLELVYAWQGCLIMVMVTVVDHRLRVRYFHWYRDLHWYRNLNVLFANLFDNFSALFLVTVALDNLVIFLTLLLKRLHTLLLWHIHCCGQTLGGNSENVQNQFWSHCLKLTWSYTGGRSQCGT